MAQIDWERARVLVEFGPGVGTIAREVLKRMRPDATLLVIGLNSEFVEYLSSTIRDPRLHIVHGSAAHVRRILAERGLAPADYIICSLPYSLLAEDARREIVEESRHALKAQGAGGFSIHAYVAALPQVDVRHGQTQLPAFQHAAGAHLPLQSAARF